MREHLSEDCPRDLHSVADDGCQATQETLDYRPVATSARRGAAPSPYSGAPASNNSAQVVASGDGEDFGEGADAESQRR